MRPRISWRLTAVGLVLAGIGLVLTARRTDVDEQLGHLAAIPAHGWAWVGVACGFQLLSLAGRSLRWRFLFASPAPRVSTLFSALCIGYLANNLIARSGELLRMWLVGRRLPDLGFIGVAVTVAAERLLDVLMILTLALLLFAVSDGGPSELVASGRAFRLLVAVAAGVAAIVVVAIRWSPELGEIARRVLAAVPARVAAVLEPLVHGALAGLDTLRRSGARGLAVVLTLCVLDWLWVMLCHRSAGLAFGIELDVLDVCLIMVGSGLGAMIPAGPGNVGSMLYLMQLAAEQTPMRPVALAYAVTMFSVYWVVRSGTGLLCLALEAPDLREKDAIL